MDTVVCGICGMVVEKRKAGPHKSAHVRSAAARYVYAENDRHHPLEWKTCPTCRERTLMRPHEVYCSHRCSKLGPLNPQWLGDKAKPRSARYRAHRRFTPDVCGLCGATSDLHRHHVDGSTYNNDPSNIQFLCASCHGKHHHASKPRRGKK